MPSKTKKHSKTTPSRLSNSEQSPSSPRTPSTVISSSDLLEFAEEDVAFSLEAASSRYPSMIGKSAFIGRLTDIDEHSRGCNLWLPESSMVASSIFPGSIVSVSLAAPGKKVLSPLSSIPVGCAGQFKVECLDEITVEVGNYFAFATVFPYSKALKDEVRFSSSLSYTMGRPALGRVVFVYPVQNQFLSELVNGNDNYHDRKVHSLTFQNCNELYLEMVPTGTGGKQSNDVKSTMSSTERTDRQSEGEKMSLLRTPLSESKLSSSSPSISASSRCDEAISNISNRSHAHSDLFDIKEVLNDENAKQLLQACATSLLYSRILISGNVVAIPIFSMLCIFRVICVNKFLGDDTDQDLMTGVNSSVCSESPRSMDHLKDAFSINHETKVYFHLPTNSALGTPYKNSLPFSQIESERVKNIMGHEVTKLGGLHKEYAVLKDIILSTMKNDFSSLGMRPTKGVLLHGPPGTGKTSLARLCSLDTGVNFFFVNGPEIISQYLGESEQAIHQVFASASRDAPSVVFIDELDSIAPARKDGGEELSQRLVTTLLNLMDGVSRTDGVLVIAATNKPNTIEPALRRSGRLDREIEIGVPSPMQRLDILRTLIRTMEHSLSDFQVQHLAVATHGFVGADLAALCNEAALICLRRYVKFKRPCSNLLCKGSSAVYESCSEITVNGSTDKFEDSASSNLQTFSENSVTASSNAIMVEEGNNLKVLFEDFEKAKMKVRPSAMREVILEVPKVNWEDVGGQEEVKAQLKEAVEWPQRHQNAFQCIGTRPPRGILLFGPPGCSKTLMARAVASEAGLNFFAVKGPELLSKWVGESEKAVRSLFAKARASAPSIIFFDEIDGLAVTRGVENDGVSVSDRVMTQLLVELDGLHQRVDVTVIAATNRPDKIDSALLRPGRFDRSLYVGPPSMSDREDIFRIHLRKIPCSSNVNIKELAHLTEGCTGADISFICREAGLAALEECMDASEVTMQHLTAAIRQAGPYNAESYHELYAKFQRSVPSDNKQECLENTKSLISSKRFNFWTLMNFALQFFSRFLSLGSRSASTT